LRQPCASTRIECRFGLPLFYLLTPAVVAGLMFVYVNGGFAHLDVVMAEDTADNHVVGPLSDFIARNIQ
jgi:hypothetical protein